MRFINAQLLQIDNSHRLVADPVFLVDLINDHTDSRSVVRDRIDQDKRACLLIFLIRIEEQLLARRENNTTDLVQLQSFYLRTLHRIDVNLITDSVDPCTSRIGSLLDIEFLFHIHRLLVHPDQHRLEITTHDRQIIRMNQHLAPRDIDLILERDRYALRWKGHLLLTLISDNAFYSRAFSGRQGHHLVALADHATGHLSAETTEIKVRTQDVLHRITEILIITIQVDGHGLQEVE